MRTHSERGQKKKNHNNFNLFEDEFPLKKSKKVERKSEKRKANQRFQNAIRQGRFDYEEDVD